MWVIIIFFGLAFFGGHKFITEIPIFIVAEDVLGVLENPKLTDKITHIEYSFKKKQMRNMGN